MWRWVAPQSDPWSGNYDGVIASIPAGHASNRLRNRLRHGKRRRRSVDASGRLLLHRDLILIELAVWHFESPRSQGYLSKLHAISAQDHSAAELLTSLAEFMRRSQRGQSSREVLQGRVAEIEVGIGGE